MSAPRSIVHGPALAEQPGLGAMTIGGYLRDVVARHGRSEAVVAWEGDRRIAWTYEELLGRAQEVARALIARGVGKDGRVGILMSNRPEFLSALFGAALAGAVPVALSTFSTPQELAYLLEASQVGTLLLERRVAGKDFAAMLRDLEPGIAKSSMPGAIGTRRYPYLQRVVCLGQEPADEGFEAWEDFLAAAAPVAGDLVFARANQVAPCDTGGVFFSSGTTSRPKGIVHSQRAFAIQWWRWGWIMGWPDPVRIWTGNGLFWSGNIVMMIGIAFSTGGAVILQPTFSAEEALRLIERERATFLNGRPHQWAQLQVAPGWAAADLSAVKYVTRGELIREHPTVATDWEVPKAFGTTETMTMCTGFPADTPREVVGDSTGAPLPGNTLKIVDPWTRAPVAIGCIGELCVKGPTLMAGYLGKAAEDCFDDEGFFCTGDAGSIDNEGRFHWHGRMNAMIKTGGANVSPEEVDEVLAQIPGVQRAQTVGVPDKLLGERVVACIVPQSGTVLDEATIRAAARQRLAAFKVPRTILFCDADEFALTGSEKVRLEELRALAMMRLEASC
ncbi:MAG: acyl--CoA ligase [Sphingomonadales bacterium]|nr:acyl--CoA ligase [Sphingomonadales bacterium]